MNRTAWMCLAIFCWLQVSSSAEAQLIVYVVRHGEKLDNSKDPPLAPAGEARAVRLAQLLSASGVKAIYTTEYRRTMQLSAPTATALNVKAVVMPANDTPGLLKKIASHAPNEAVLVVGHSNTVPEILNGLGHFGEVKIAETEFDNLFVLVPRPQGPPVVAQLKY